VIGPLIRRSKIDTIGNLIFIAYLTFCYFLPDMCGDVPNPKCLASYGLRHSVVYFGWIILLPYCVCKTIWHFVVLKCFNTNEYIESSPRLLIMMSFALIVFFFFMIATPIWFYWSMVIWP
jgi:hypothetical protein